MNNGKMNPTYVSLKTTIGDVQDYRTRPIINTFKAGLKADELKSLTDADKYYYDDKNFKTHKNKIKNNILGCRDRCSKIMGEYDVSFDFEACKKGCHIESPYYCTTECPNNDMHGKMFYFDDKKKPFKGNCSKSGNKKDCEKGKVYFRDLWDGKKNYEMSNRKLHGNECMGVEKFYKDTACDEEISLKDRYSKILKSYKDYKTEDTQTYDNIIKNIMDLRKKNNEKTSSIYTRMDKLIKDYKKLREPFETLGGRLEDNKLLLESEMYKKIGISILGITLLLITAKKLNNL